MLRSRRANRVEAGLQVTRQRRRVSRARLGVFGGAGHRRRIVAVGATAVVLAGAGVTYASTEVFGDNQVGTQYANGIQVSDDQIIKPLGDRLLTQFGKFMGSTVSPDGRFLAATSTDKSVVLQIFDLSSYKLIWTVGTAAAVNQKLTDGTVGQEGPTYSPDGKFLWLPEQNGLTRFPVNADGTLGTPTTFSIPTVNGHSALVGQTKYSPDGSTLYAALNGQNTVVALDPNTGAVEQTWNVGIAPRELTFVGGKLYVSDEGGRQAQAGDTTMDSYGTQVPANGYLGTSTTGTVSVIDTANPSAAVGSIAVGLHPTAMYVKRQRAVRRQHEQRHRLGHRHDQGPGRADDRDQAVAVVGRRVRARRHRPDRGRPPAGHARPRERRRRLPYHGDPQQPVSYIGLLPTDYYPATVATVGDQIVVTNTRGIDARGPAITTYKGQGTVPRERPRHAQHHRIADALHASERPGHRARHGDGLRAERLGQERRPAGQGRQGGAVPVPTRIGDPSTIKHVFLLVKENRTYDQVFGDMGEGNGDPTLAQFGAKVTPNQHALAKQFGLYDNTYDVGTNSAEGHNWLMQGDNPEYTESSAGEYQRSYDTEEDVLGHQRSGFLWTAVESAGDDGQELRRVRVHGGQAVRDVAAVLLRGQERRERR